MIVLISPASDELTAVMSNGTARTDHKTRELSVALSGAPDHSFDFMAISPTRIANDELIAIKDLFANEPDTPDDLVIQVIPDIRIKLMSEIYA